MSWTDDVDWQRRQDATEQAKLADAAARRAFVEQQRPLLQRVAAEVALLPKGFQRSGRPTRQWAGASMFGRPVITGWLCVTVTTSGPTRAAQTSEQVIATEDGDLLIRTTLSSESDTVRAKAVRRATTVEAAKLVLGVTDKPWRGDGCNYLEDRDGDIVHITRKTWIDSNEQPLLEVSVRGKLLAIVNQTPLPVHIIRPGEPGFHYG